MIILTDGTAALPAAGYTSSPMPGKLTEELPKWHKNKFKHRCEQRFL